MTDKFNKNNGPEDINKFFEQFDSIEDDKTGAQKTESASMAGRSVESTNSTRASRSKRTKKSKNNKSARTAQTKAASHLKFLTTNKKGEPLSTKSKILRFILLAVIAVMILGFVYVGALILTADTHNIDADNIYSRLSQRSTLYDDQGNEIESVFSEDGNRDNVSYSEIPENMVNAIVAIEDKTFWKHNGFNFIRIAGAIKESIFGGGEISGTSTLTQQLARNIYLAETKSQRSMNRKILEAYYAVLIEKSLTKEQIVEAYLNTVYLGYNCYGVEAASQAYFNKSVTELDLLECVALASLPKSPNSYALVKSYPVGTIEIDPENIIESTETMEYVYNGDLSEGRRSQTLFNMVDQGYIEQADADKAEGQNLKDKVQISVSNDNSYSSYFTDYVIDQISDDLVEEYGWTEEMARDKIYTGGLKIYTTMDSNAQKIAVTEFETDSNFPSVSNLAKDSDGNITNGYGGRVILYDYDDYFNENNEFVLTEDEYTKNSDGSMTLYAGNRLNFYDITYNGTSDVSLTFNPLYVIEDYKFYSIEDGALSVPQGYKTKDAKGNCVISADFFTDYPEFFQKGEDGSLIVSSANYSLKQKVSQPQAAIVIMDYKTGGIKAMVGGRNVDGKMLLNRALTPQQPGSSIKPLAVYSSALQYSFNAEARGEKLTLDDSDGSRWGDYMTAGSIINDKAMTVNGKTWPKNWYSGYKGHMTLRTAVEQSVNVCAVKVYQQMGPEFPVEQLKKMGITTVVEADEDSAVNDLNPAALALGGMTKGISPLEMAAAYGIFPNEGQYTSPIAYTKITNSNDEVIFEKAPDTEQVLDEGVAYIMTDILRSVVTRGIGSAASFGGQPVAGKTGTTNDQFDIWFCGFTPQYSAAVWMGNDFNIELSSSSSTAARMWRTIMSQVCEDLPYGQYPDAPENVERRGGEYYTEGTYSKVSKPTSETEASSSKETDKESESKTETVEKTTKASTKQVTKAPTTQAPTTQAPTTQAPTTQAPTTQAPATEPPTTQAPTTQAPATEPPATEVIVPTDSDIEDEDIEDIEEIDLETDD